MVHGIWRGSLSILVALNNREHPTTGEWDAYCDTVRGFLADPAGTAHLRALSISDGGGPTARQRSQVAALTGAYHTRWALVSSSRFARGIGMALAWAIGGFKAFAPQELRQTLHYLDVSAEETPGLVRAIHELDVVMQLSAVARFEQPESILE